MTEEDNYRNDFVLYLHRNKVTDEIFYVGIGAIKRSKSVGGRNILWKRYVQVHGKPKIEIYRQNLNMIEAINLEYSFIRALGRRIEKTGNLTNLDRGGTGVALTRRSEESINKAVAARRLSYKTPVGKDNWSYGISLTEDHKLKISKSLKGVKQTASHIEKRSSCRKGKRMNQASIDKMAASLRGKVLPESVKAKISQSSKVRWKDDAFRNARCVEKKGKIKNARKVINNVTGEIYANGKIAADAVGIKKGYFTAMIGGFFDNKTGCSYLEPRPFSSGKERKREESLSIKN